MTAVENLRKPAREGTFQRVWVTLGDAHLDRAAPRVDLLVNANLDAIYFCTSRYHIPIKPLHLCYLGEFQTIIYILLTSTIWLSNNGAADRTSPWLNSCILWLWVWPVFHILRRSTCVAWLLEAVLPAWDKVTSWPERPWKTGAWDSETKGLSMFEVAPPVIWLGSLEAGKLKH